MNRKITRMENAKITLDQVNEGLKTLAKRHNVSLDALSKVYYFIKDVKRELEKNPMVSLSSMIVKHKISNNYVSALYDKAVENPKDKPRTHKVWTAGEVTPRLAFDIMQYKRQLAKGYGSYLKKKEKSKEKAKTANQIGNLMGIDSGRYNFDTKSYINAAIEDYPENDFTLHKILGFFRRVKDMVEADTESRLGNVHKDFALPSAYLTYLKSYGWLLNKGSQIAPVYEWLKTEKLTMDEAKKAKDIYNKAQGVKREERRNKKEEEKKLRQQIDEKEEAARKEKLQETVDQQVNEMANQQTTQNLKDRLPEDSAMKKAIEKAEEVIETVKKVETQAAEESKKTATVAVTAEPIKRRGHIYEAEDVDPAHFFKVRPMYSSKTKYFKLFGLNIWSITETKEVK